MADRGAAVSPSFPASCSGCRATIQSSNSSCLFWPRLSSLSQASPRLKLLHPLPPWYLLPGTPRLTHRTMSSLSVDTLIGASHLTGTKSKFLTLALGPPLWHPLLILSAASKIFLLFLEHPSLFLPQGLCTCCLDHSPPGLNSNLTSSKRPSVTHLIQTGFLSLLPNQYLLRLRKHVALFLVDLPDSPSGKQASKHITRASIY